MKRKRATWGTTICLLAVLLALAACGRNGGGDRTGASPASPAAASGQASAPNGAAAASPSAATAATPQLRTVTDDLGHVLQIPVHPQRVLAPYLEDPLTVLGVKPVAQWANGDIVQEYLQTDLAGLPKVDFSGGGLVPEQAAAQNPDLIILIFKAWADNGLYEQYAKIAPTYVFENGMTDWRQTLRKLGDLLGKSDAAAQAIADFDSQVATAKEQIHKAIGDQEVALLWPSGKSIYLLSDQDYSGHLLYEDLGITEPALAKGQSFQNISLEKLPEIGKDHIFLITQYNDEESSQLRSDPVWQHLPAVQAGRVHEISWDHWMNNGLMANRLNLADTLSALVKD